MNAMSHFKLLFLCVQMKEIHCKQKTCLAARISPNGDVVIIKIENAFSGQALCREMAQLQQSRISRSTDLGLKRLSN